MEYHAKILAFSVNLLYKYHNLDKRNQSPIDAIFDPERGRREHAEGGFR